MPGDFPQRALGFKGQRRAVRAIHALLQLRTCVRQPPLRLAGHPCSLGDSLIAAAKIPGLNSRHGHPNPTQEAPTPGRRWQFLCRLPKRRPQPAQPTLRMEMLRPVVRQSMHHRIVCIDHHHEPVGIRVEMQMPDDRREHLQHRRPSACTQPRMQETHLAAQHRGRKCTQRRLVGRRLAENREFQWGTRRLAQSSRSSGTPPSTPANHMSPSDPSRSNSSKSGRSINRANVALRPFFSAITISSG